MRERQATAIFQPSPVRGTRNLGSGSCLTAQHEYRCWDGECKGYQMTGAYSRPQEFPLFQKFSFSKMEGIRLCHQECISVTPVLGNCCQVWSSKGKDLIRKDSSSLGLSTGAGYASQVRCQQECLFLPPSWEAEINVISGWREVRGLEYF